MGKKVRDRGSNPRNRRGLLLDMDSVCDMSGDSDMVL